MMISKEEKVSLVCLPELISRLCNEARFICEQFREVLIYGLDAFD